MYEQFGFAHQEDGSYEFRLFVPDSAVGRPLFSEQNKYADVPFSTDGVWQDLLSGGQVDVENYRLGNWRAPSNWGCLFWQKE